MSAIVEVPGFARLTRCEECGGLGIEDEEPCLECGGSGRLLRQACAVFADTAAWRYCKAGADRERLHGTACGASWTAEDPPRVVQRVPNLHLLRVPA